MTSNNNNKKKAQSEVSPDTARSDKKLCRTGLGLRGDRRWCWAWGSVGTSRCTRPDCRTDCRPARFPTAMRVRIQA
eukprot:658909-Rhodomonas_salina.4